ncbi:hypothetical protein [Campylobacter sp. CCS1377]|uniref:Uncharacterized protein n=1 Tax=Campylobacter sp. CCS1377 TaxID=3158229 RepID=A0AAU7E659_9BACT
MVNNTEIKTLKVPNELLILERLKKPNAKNEMDILKAYADLFYHYEACKVQINKIKELNND